MRTAEPTARQAGFAGEGRPPKARGLPSPQPGPWENIPRTVTKQWSAILTSPAVCGDIGFAMGASGPWLFVS